MKRTNFFSFCYRVKLENEKAQLTLKNKIAEVGFTFFCDKCGTLVYGLSSKKSSRKEIN